MENMVAVISANYFPDTLRLDTVPHLTNGQHNSRFSACANTPLGNEVM
jgi:hypothetical protein